MYKSLVPDIESNIRQIAIYFTSIFSCEDHKTSNSFLRYYEFMSSGKKLNSEKPYCSPRKPFIIALLSVTQLYQTLRDKVKGDNKKSVTFSIQ